METEVELQETCKAENKAKEVVAMANQDCQQQGMLGWRCGDSHQQPWVLMVEWCYLQLVWRSTLPSRRGCGQECTVPGDVHPNGDQRDPKTETV